MAFTHKGKRIAFDNIAVGSATGRERTRVGTTLFIESTLQGNGERLRTATTLVASTPGAGEFHLRTVSGGLTTDKTTDGGH